MVGMTISALQSHSDDNVRTVFLDEFCQTPDNFRNWRVDKRQGILIVIASRHPGIPVAKEN
jgi:hypothetical protein